MFDRAEVKARRPCAVQVRPSRAFVLVAMWPLIDPESAMKPVPQKTPVRITVRGVSGRAAGFVETRVARIANAADPDLGGADLGVLHCGRYTIDATFDGDSIRLPTTLHNEQVVPGNC